MLHNPTRPLSPHLSIWKWGPHMLVSILHRVCGVALATAGIFVFTWWLVALAGGPESYDVFHRWVVAAPDGDGFTQAVNILARVVAIGLTWTFFQHLANGVRHLFLDIGSGYELRINKTGAMAAVVFAPLATIALWAYVLVGKA